MKTSELTKGERLMIRRRRMNLSQSEMANELGVSLYRYRLWEAGEDLAEAPKITLGRIHDFEVCVIQRRRAGVDAKKLAAQLGVSRWWLTQMEYGRGPADRLVTYWKKRAA